MNLNSASQDAHHLRELFLGRPERQPERKRNDNQTCYIRARQGRDWFQDEFCERTFHIEYRTCLWCGCKKPDWVILRCFSRSNFHTQVQEQIACGMHSTFIQTAAGKGKTKLPVRCFPQPDQSSKVQRHTKSIPSVRCVHHMSTQQLQPLRSFHSASATQGCKTLSKTDAINFALD